MQPNLRKATHDDIALIVAIRAASILSHPRTVWNDEELQRAADWCTEDKIETELNEGYQIYIHDDKALVAYDEDYVAYLFLMPELHNRGLGSALLKFAEQHIIDAGHKRIYLWTAGYAFRFYEKHGYTRLTETSAPFGLEVSKFMKQL